MDVSAINNADTAIEPVTEITETAEIRKSDEKNGKNISENIEKINISDTENTDKHDPNVENADPELTAAKERAALLEAKVFCLESGVPSEMTDDVINLAKSSFSGKSLNESVSAVLGKYPFFLGNKKPETRKVTTGVHLEPCRGDSAGGVEEAFLRSNPGIKLNF